MFRLPVALMFAGLAALCVTGGALARHPARSHRAPTPAAAPGHYDYYVMALSWSPTYCQTHADEQEQCGHQGYGFVLHGLWPQDDRGRGPERCATDAMPERRTVAEALAFMPSKRLITHEWRTHGSCTGLDPAGYFALADRAFAAVRVPPELMAPRQDLTLRADELRAAFKRANPALADDMFSLHCSKGDLVEVRICLDKSDLAPRQCGQRMRSGCPRSAPFSLPAAN